MIKNGEKIPTKKFFLDKNWENFFFPDKIFFKIIFAQKKTIKGGNWEGDNRERNRDIFFWFRSMVFGGGRNSLLF